MIRQKLLLGGPGPTETRPQDMTKRRKLLIFGVMAFGQFMALLDIQIVAASLNDVQAGLSAAPDEISWVQTAYLIAELVMIPLSAFLAGALSTRWLFAASAALFTLSSVLCGLAWNIESMIAFRAIQGFTGGAMIPTVFAVGFALFEGKERAMIPAILGMVAVLAPTLGPTVGGAITSAFGWRWIFFINFIPGLAVALLSASLVTVDKAEPARLRNIDWSHLIAMTAMLAGLQFILEEGPRLDWFESYDIRIAAWASVVALGLFLQRSFFSPNPIVRLTPFQNSRFVFACIFNLVIGFGIYAATYLVPVYLGRVRGFDSLQIGTTVFVVGLAQIASVFLAAKLSQRVDPRIMIASGLCLFALSLWLTSSMNSQWGFWELLIPQLVRGLSIMLCIVPSVTLALGEFSGSELRYASGLFNLMRNLGGAVGIAIVNSWLIDGSQLHGARFVEALGHHAHASGTALSALADRIGHSFADQAHGDLIASGILQGVIVKEALTLSFNDIFRAMSLTFVGALLLVPLCKAPRTGLPR